MERGVSLRGVVLFAADFPKNLSFFSLCSNNILYPKEEREQKILLYACRNCDHQVTPLKTL